MTGNERAFAKELRDLLETMTHDEETPLLHRLVKAQDFEELGMLTSDAGFMVLLSDGSEYEVTIVQSNGAEVDVDAADQR